MNKKLSEIILLIEELPSKDRLLASNFIQNRDFQSLLEIVESVIILHLKHVRLSKNKENTFKEEYKELNLNGLRVLEAAIYEYASDLLINNED